MSSYYHPSDHTRTVYRHLCIIMSLESEKISCETTKKNINIIIENLIEYPYDFMIFFKDQEIIIKFINWLQKICCQGFTEQDISVIEMLNGHNIPIIAMGILKTHVIQSTQHDNDIIFSSDEIPFADAATILLS